MLGKRTVGCSRRVVEVVGLVGEMTMNSKVNGC